MVRKQKKPKLSKEQIAENKRRRTFQKKIEDIFVSSGFESLKVNGKQFQLGGKSNELDHCFLYENIMVICEDTLKSKKAEEKAKENGIPYHNDHKMQKNETAGNVKGQYKKDFIGFLKSTFPEENLLSKYNFREFRIFYLYFEYDKKQISNDDKERFSELIFIDRATCNYFYEMSNSIKASFRFELFRFLKIERSSIGKADPSGSVAIRPITTSIIYPDSVTGFCDGIRMVSFMMKPSDLLENCCVLRKDGWEQSMDLYQRLITPKRIKSIRDYVVANKTTFLNNIIITLPHDVRFFDHSDGKSKEISIDEIQGYSRDIEMDIPAEFNSMAIIDGQHRVYAYYESKDKTDPNEIEISRLRNELNLLVTGIIYPEGTKYDDDLEKRKFESSLFVSINKNAKPVDADTLIQVQSIMNPASGVAISRRVIEELNKQSPFMDMFQLSKVVDAPIKTASIIQFALSSLLSPKNIATSLYSYWLSKNRKNADFILSSSGDIAEYVKFCTNSLVAYFKSINSKFGSYWNKDSKLLKVISINAFIIAYRETLPVTNGPQDIHFYDNVFKDFSFSFDDTPEHPFPYSGSRYKKFARETLIPLFGKSAE